jgi:hypothetical protein
MYNRYKRFSIKEYEYHFMLEVDLELMESGLVNIYLG